MANSLRTGNHHVLKTGNHRTKWFTILVAAWNHQKPLHIPVLANEGCYTTWLIGGLELIITTNALLYLACHHKSNWICWKIIVKSCSKTIFSLKSDAPSRTKGDSTWDKRMASRIHHGSLWMPCPYPQKHHGLHGQKMTIVWVWVKQQIINHAWLGMVNISPTKMMIWGMVYDIVLPTLHVAFAIWK